MGWGVSLVSAPMPGPLDTLRRSCASSGHLHQTTYCHSFLRNPPQPPGLRSVVSGSSGHYVTSQSKVASKAEPAFEGSALSWVSISLP